MSDKMKRELAAASKESPLLAAILAKEGSSAEAMANALLRAGWPEDDLLQKLRREQLAERDAARFTALA